MTALITFRFQKKNCNHDLTNVRFIIISHRVQTSLLKCKIWHRLNQCLRPLSEEHSLRIVDIKTDFVRGQTNRLIYSCRGKFCSRKQMYTKLKAHPYTGELYRVQM